MLTLAYVTHPSREKAREFCDTLLSERLIACFVLMDSESAYWWSGAMERANETVSLLKTTPECWGELRLRIRELHPYDIPCVLNWEVAANPEYEEWVRGEVKIM